MAKGYTKEIPRIPQKMVNGKDTSLPATRITVPVEHQIRHESCYKYPSTGR
ncbi:hypothetical protein KBB48_01290 [Candidatus Shapirobacteria bacterium]|nr:hypothetical protein [Candidatus Shapirobacteria bacterium]